MDVLMIKDGVVEFVSSVNSIEETQPYYPEYTIIERTGDEWEGWLYIDGSFSAPSSQVNQSTSAITKLAFLNRFTDTEAIMIDLAGQGATPEAAMMRRVQKKIDAAAFIDLNDSATRNGVLALEQFGLLGQGRSIEILDTPVDPKERYTVGS